MKYVKTIGILILVVLFIVLVITLKCCSDNEAMEAEETEKVYGVCDYFNGEIKEISEEYLVLKPTADWTWEEAKRVLIPVKQMRGDFDIKTIPTPLFGGELSDLKPGDKIRVAFNAKTMKWLEDDVCIEVVFMLYRLSDNP